MHSLLDHPRVYHLKSAICSFGRTPVRTCLRQEFPVAPGARVLDVGCGPGRHARTFSARYTGVDIHAAYLEHAVKTGHGVFARMSATALGFAEETFDLVFCVGLLHHLPDQDVTATVREMRRCTKPGGRTVVVEAVLPAGWNIAGRTLMVLDRGTHIRSVAGLSELIGPQGFELICDSVPPSFPYRRAVWVAQ